MPLLLFDCGTAALDELWIAIKIVATTNNTVVSERNFLIDVFLLLLKIRVSVSLDPAKNVLDSGSTFANLNYGFNSLKEGSNILDPIFSCPVNQV